MLLNFLPCTGRPPPRAFFPSQVETGGAFWFQGFELSLRGPDRLLCPAPWHPTGCSPVRLLRPAGGPAVAASPAAIKSGS